METSIRSTEAGENFNKMVEEAAQLVADGENNNVIVIVAKKDHNFHVLTDINVSAKTTFAMLKHAADMIYAAKQEQIKSTNGEPEVVES